VAERRSLLRSCISDFRTQADQELSCCEMTTLMIGGSDVGEHALGSADLGTAPRALSHARAA
jgi:hypothetical protein